MGRVILFGLIVGLTFAATAAADTIPAPLPRCTINGTAGDDTLFGTGHADVICGHQGDDLIIGGGGTDVLRGGRGSDVLNARDGASHDVLVCAKGQDTAIADHGDRVDVTCERVFNHNQ